MSEENLNEVLKRLEEQKEKLSKLLEVVNDIMKKIEEQGEVLKEVMEKREEERILLESVKDVGMEKKKRCYYYEEGFCRLWYWKKNPEEVLFVIKSRKFVGKDGKEKWRIDPHPFYCALCQEFKERV
jgi:regulator of replication initiation timing